MKDNSFYLFKRDNLFSIYLSVLNYILPAIINSSNIYKGLYCILLYIRFITFKTHNQTRKPKSEMKTKDIKEEFTSTEFFTIPNILSIIRILMIPLIVWAYCFKKDLQLAFILFAVSAFTDVADGFIARRFNMITEAGKILDPIADKLTQAAVIFCLCLTIKSVEMWVLLGVLVVKELAMFIMGLVSLKAVDEVSGAKWFGKLSTVVIFLVVGVNSLFGELNPIVHLTSILIAIAFMSLSLIKYALFYRKIIKSYKKEQNKR